jgi:hypothetical protein
MDRPVREIKLEDETGDNVEQQRRRGRRNERPATRLPFTARLLKGQVPLFITACGNERIEIRIFGDFQAHRRGFLLRDDAVTVGIGSIEHGGALGGRIHFLGDR